MTEMFELSIIIQQAFFIIFEYLCIYIYYITI